MRKRVRLAWSWLNGPFEVRPRREGHGDKSPPVNAGCSKQPHHVCFKEGVCVQWQARARL